MFLHPSVFKYNIILFYHIGIVFYLFPLFRFILSWKNVACSTIRHRTLFVRTDGTIILQTDHMPNQTTLAVTFYPYKKIASNDLIPSLHDYGVAGDNKVWVGMKQGNRWLYCCFPFPVFNSIGGLCRCHIGYLYLFIDIRIQY